MNIPSELVSSEQLHEYGEFAEVAARAGVMFFGIGEDDLLFLQRGREIL